MLYLSKLSSPVAFPQQPNKITKQSHYAKYKSNQNDPYLLTVF